ncbi:high affinity copper uptake protein 1 isoform X2 [Contarinia nasturtii]|uniref:high affinity copper uptake protein 1 isoform X2 n=1 Tax=Contarinia nasturtii TaxID=265458 RepID=UPI0012D41A25|nr:high affinity copper uptake protein 1 isoform X2 [Contarinia nasturtii]
MDHSAHMGHNHVDHGMDHSNMDHSNMDHSNMDHSTMHGDNSGNARHDMGHMMDMTFHFGYTEEILFKQWSIDSTMGLILSVILIAAMAALYEGLKYYREYLFWKTYNSLQYRAVTLPDKNAVVGVNSEDTTGVKPSMTSFMHIYQTFLHILQVTLSFLLMLIFMTYNVWLCLGVVVGAAIGYFLFGWKKSVIVDITEHCH